MQKKFRDDISNGFRSGGFLTLVARVTSRAYNEIYGCAMKRAGCHVRHVDVCGAVTTVRYCNWRPVGRVYTWAAIFQNGISKPEVVSRWLTD